MGKEVAKVFGIDTPKMPEPVMIPEAPKADKVEEASPVDAEARATALRRAEEEKKRRGRKSLRNDVSTSGAVGAGVAIPG